MKRTIELDYSYQQSLAPGEEVADTPPQAAAPKRLARAARGVCYGACVFTTLLLIVRLSSPDPTIKTFPSSCAVSADGCVRVTEDNPHRADKLVPLRLEATPSDVAGAVEAWLRAGGDRAHGSGGVVSAGADKSIEPIPSRLVHGRLVSALWGFADDVAVLCKQESELVTFVEAQAELRIGKSDIGANGAHLRSLFAHLKDKFTPVP
eukprot:CAMPEP_0170146674 /NCGR_PEP_ID=MMETSP0033_2-20121228/31339_1 /TAXON_ID=195969 /ORGANISM="Dolichomastix tenuilepis, Strain CCMP3274" /LENGTH=206 /DNA_ID=CAMNT_0010383423 /DNA_START=107 /DNA_END=727 /DNA_ORIENTATION=+